MATSLPASRYLSGSALSDSPTRTRLQFQNFNTESCGHIAYQEEEGICMNCIKYFRFTPELLKESIKKTLYNYLRDKQSETNLDLIILQNKGYKPQTDTNGYYTDYLKLNHSVDNFHIEDDDEEKADDTMLEVYYSLIEKIKSDPHIKALTPAIMDDRISRLYKYANVLYYDKEGQGKFLKYVEEDQYEDEAYQDCMEEDDYEENLLLKFDDEFKNVIKRCILEDVDDITDEEMHKTLKKIYHDEWETMFKHILNRNSNLED